MHLVSERTINDDDFSIVESIPALLAAFSFLWPIVFSCKKSNVHVNVKKICLRS